MHHLEPELARPAGRDHRVPALPDADRLLDGPTRQPLVGGRDHLVGTLVPKWGIGAQSAAARTAPRERMLTARRRTRGRRCSISIGKVDLCKSDAGWWLRRPGAGRVAAALG